LKQYPKPVFDDAHDERRRAEEEKERRREALRKKVRESFPEMTAFADEMRKQFPGARLVWAAEKQHVIGPVPEDVRRKHEEEFGPLVDVSKEK
jgi:hypothetical protein